MRAEIDPRLEAITERIIGAAFMVSNTLGHGFLETVYKNAMMEELVLHTLTVTRERPFPVVYRGKEVGRYIADLVVDGIVIVEIKAVTALAAAHRSQVLNYLKASRLPVGLLFNFGSARLEMRRIIL